MKRTKKFSHEVTRRDTKKKNLCNLGTLWASLSVQEKPGSNVISFYYRKMHTKHDIQRRSVRYRTWAGRYRTGKIEKQASHLLFWPLESPTISISGEVSLLKCHPGSTDGNFIARRKKVGKFLETATF